MSRDGERGGEDRVCVCVCCQQFRWCTYLRLHPLPLLLQLRILLGLLLLFAHRRLLLREALLLLVRVDLVVLRLLLLELEPVVLLLELVRAGDLLEEQGELHRRLDRELRDVALEDEEAGVGLRLDAERLHLLRVDVEDDLLAVDAVLADAVRVDHALEGGLLALARLVDERDGGGALLVALVALGLVDEVLKLLAAKVARLQADGEGDRVHEVRFARAVRADHRRKIFERSDDLGRAAVRFKVGDLDRVEAAGVLLFGAAARRRGDDGAGHICVVLLLSAAMNSCRGALRSRRPALGPRFAERISGRASRHGNEARSRAFCALCVF